MHEKEKEPLQLLAVRNELNRHGGVPQIVEQMRGVTRHANDVDIVTLNYAILIDRWYKFDKADFSREQKYLHSFYVGMYIGHVATGWYQPETIDNLKNSFLPKLPDYDDSDDEKSNRAENLMRYGIARRRHNDGLNPHAMEAPLEEMSETKEEELVLSSLMAFGYSWSSGELRRGK